MGVNVAAVEVVEKHQAVALGLARVAGIGGIALGWPGPLPPILLSLPVQFHRLSPVHYHH